jgi:hypothetical protein
MVHRFRVLYLEHRVEDLGLETAIAERRREATGALAAPGPTS